MRAKWRVKGSLYIAKAWIIGEGCPNRCYGVVRARSAAHKYKDRVERRLLGNKSRTVALNTFVHCYFYRNDEKKKMLEEGAQWNSTVLTSYWFSIYIPNEGCWQIVLLFIVLHKVDSNVKSIGSAVVSDWPVSCSQKSFSTIITYLGCIRFYLPWSIHFSYFIFICCYSCFETFIN